MDTTAINGFMLIVYQTLEKMNRDERRFFIKSIKEARRILDFNYPQGKPEIAIPSEAESVAILRPNS